MKTPFPTSGRRGFSLVEVTLSLALVTFCLCTLTGLLWVGLSSNKIASAQTAANNLLAGVISDLRATPLTTSKSLLYGITIPANTATSTATIFLDSDGNLVTNSASASTYRVTISFVTPSGSAVASGAATRTATLAVLKVTWPAAATVANAQGAVDTFVALDRS